MQTLHANSKIGSLNSCNQPSQLHGGGSKKGIHVTSSWSHLIAGAAGGMMTALVTSPLDVLKTRLQSDFYHTQLKTISLKSGSRLPLSIYQSSLLHFRETFAILFSIHRVEGWHSLFRGLGPSITGVVPATAIKFYTYGNCKRVLPDILSSEKDATLVHVLSAATAGIITGTATNPIWVVKTRLQLDRSRMQGNGSGGVLQYRGSIDCVKQVLQQEGLKGLYRGLGASYLGVIETTLHLTLYERVKGFINKRGDDQRGVLSSSAVQDASLSFAAGLSKLFAAVVAYPHEVIRTRLRQAPMANGRQKYTGVIQCLRLVWKEEGVMALYGGLTAHLLRTVPAAVITLGTYELVLKFLQ